MQCLHGSCKWTRRGTERSYRQIQNNASPTSIHTVTPSPPEENSKPIRAGICAACSNPSQHIFDSDSVSREKLHPSLPTIDLHFSHASNFDLLETILALPGRTHCWVCFFAILQMLPTTCQLCNIKTLFSYTRFRALAICSSYNKQLFLESDTMMPLRRRTIRNVVQWKFLTLLLETSFQRKLIIIPSLIILKLLQRIEDELKL